MGMQRTTLLFFHIEGCHWCKWVKENVIYWMEKDVKTYGSVDFYKVNAYNFYDVVDYSEFGATGDELAEELDVFLFPTIIIMSGDVEVGRIVGVALEDEYWHSVDKLLDIS
jgi:thiol-disulfide isomerase/thioredoxin